MIYSPVQGEQHCPRGMAPWSHSTGHLSNLWHVVIPSSQTQVSQGSLADVHVSPLSYSTSSATQAVIDKIIKTCLKRPLLERAKLVFNTNYGLMQVKSVAECSKGSNLQYFQLSLSYHLSLRSLFCLFVSGRLRQVLQYI